MEQNTPNARKKPVIIGALILVVLLVIGVASYFFLLSPRAPQPTSDPNRVANLTFGFDQVTAHPGEEISLDIFLESSISVTEADIVLAYDPEAILITDIQPSSQNFMGTPAEYEITEDNISNEDGLATFRIKARETGNPPSSTRQGRGIISIVRLAAHPTFQGETSLIILKDEDIPNLTSQVLKANYNGSILETAGSIEIQVQ